MVVASAMNSTTSSTCVQLASLLSRTPSAAEIDSPLAQMPGKPASSTIRALRPLWASSRHSTCGDARSCRKAVVRLRVPLTRCARLGRTTPLR